MVVFEHRNKYKVYIYTYNTNSLNLNPLDSSMNVLILSDNGFSWWSPFGAVANEVLRYKVL